VSGVSGSKESPVDGNNVTNDTTGANVPASSSQETHQGYQCRFQKITEFILRFALKYL
jgi:hypothetical protein